MRVLIENDLIDIIDRWIESYVDRVSIILIFDYPSYYAFPPVDIRLDAIRYQAALLISVPLDVQRISCFECT